MKRYLLILPLMLSISACAVNTSKLTLDKKLQGNSTEVKQAELHLACLNEAKWSSDVNKKKHRGHRHNFNEYLNSTEETRRLKVLCRKMTENYEIKETK